MKEKNTIDLLYNGHVFPIFYDYHSKNFKIEIKLAGKSIQLVCSTTRRSLSLSLKDTCDNNLFVSKNDYMFSIPSKKTQYYSTKVNFCTEDNEINYTRYQICVSSGNFESRLGLIGTHKKLNIFNQLKLNTNIFAICTNNINKNIYLLFGSAILIPKHAIKVNMIEDTISNKGLLLFNFYAIQLLNEISCKFSLKAIVCYEFSGICLPQLLYDWLIKKYNKQNFHILLKNINEYISILVDVKNCDVLLYPINKDIVILGNCVFKDKSVAFNRNLNCAWIW